MSRAERTGDGEVSLLYGLSKEELVRIIVDDARNWRAQARTHGNIARVS
jgi:hypothetical protein